MPENEFEKQVQQKMNELKFVPSEAAWERVEKQIANKKKRRRALLWLPLLLLLLGGTAGYYYMNQKTAQNEHDLAAKPAPVNDEKKRLATENEKTGTKTNNKDALVQESTNVDRIPHNSPSSKKLIAPWEKSNPTNLTSTQTFLNKSNLRLITKKTTPLKDQEAATAPAFRLKKVADAGKQPVHKINIAQKDSELEKENIQANGNPVTTETTLNNAIKKTSTDNEEKDLAGTPDPGIAVGIQFQVSNDSTNIAKHSGIDSIKNIRHDSVAHTAAKQASQSKREKIEWGLHLDAGFSTITSGFPGFFVKRVNTGAYSATPGNPGSSGNLNNGNSSYTSPSDIKSHFSWSAGITVRKSIGKTWRLNSGLNYSMYATGIALGSKVTDSVGLDKAVYRNGRSGTYTNRFHFIELPLTIEKQLGHRSRFSINGGLAFSLLAASNQLHFDQQTNLYYTDNSLINKTQWSLLAGLNYRILQKKIQVETGPLLNYHLGNTFNKDIYGNGHWFFAGLRATVFFGERKK